MCVCVYIYVMCEILEEKKKCRLNSFYLKGEEEEVKVCLLFLFTVSLVVKKKIFAYFFTTPKKCLSLLLMIKTTKITGREGIEKGSRHLFLQPFPLYSFFPFLY